MTQVSNDDPTLDQMFDAHLKLRDALSSAEALRRRFLDEANRLKSVQENYRANPYDGAILNISEAHNSWLSAKYRYRQACRLLREAIAEVENMLASFEHTPYNPIKGHALKQVAEWIAGAAHLVRTARAAYKRLSGEYNSAIQKVNLGDDLVKARFEAGKDWVGALIARPSADAPVLDPLVLDCRNNPPIGWRQFRDDYTCRLGPIAAAVNQVVRFILPTPLHHCWNVERISQEVGSPAVNVLSDAVDMGYGTSYVDPEPVPAVGARKHGESSDDGESFRFYTRKAGHVDLLFRLTDWSKGYGVEKQRWQFALWIEDKDRAESACSG